MTDEPNAPPMLTDEEWERVSDALGWDDAAEVSRSALDKIKQLLRPAIVHQGIKLERLPFGDLEAAFAKEWARINVPAAGVNYGNGTLQDLMFVPNPDYPQSVPTRIWGGRFAEIINQRDARIVATVIQWLGTNVGFGFLLTVLRGAGYEVRDIRPLGERGMAKAAAALAAGGKP